ncbi:MAG: SpoVR family protein [Sulfurifustis sp.]
MARPWDTTDLEEWDERIRAKAEEFGLSCFAQEFEVCDQEQMLGYMAYHGMPAHYPHWSFGKAYEKLKTLYHYGLSGLPYEMVINANPSLAYLMRDNSLCLQLLTVAHVYGHNDFFRNNYMFRDTRPELTLGLFKLHADRIRGYIEDPSIGLAKVEEILDAAHALSLQCRRHTAIRKLTPDEQREYLLQAAEPPKDPYERIHKPKEYKAPDLSKVPLEPEEDVLLFIADNNPYLAEWQRDLLRIVHAQALYFLPQIETKIMNEGWASFWHHRIMNSLDLPEDLHFEFLVHHNQVVRPHLGSINPYYLGFKVWMDVEKRHGGEFSDGGRAAIFEARESERDVSFLRRFLTRELMEEMHMFEYKRDQQQLVVSRVANEEDWETIKQTLLRGVGMNTVPVIRIVDADFRHNRTLRLIHEHDGRDLELEHLERTMKYLYQLWGRPVLLETHVKDDVVTFSRTENGFERLKQ